MESVVGGARGQDWRSSTGSWKNGKAMSYPKPKVITRTEWGCPDGQITTHGELTETVFTHLIVHHTAMGQAGPGDDWSHALREIWELHVMKNGWADLGYHVLIDPCGAIYEGRSGGDQVKGAHFSGKNDGAWGVSVIGVFNSSLPTESALESLVQILAWRVRETGVDPLGRSYHAASGLYLDTISGHRDGPGVTECPGDALYGLLPQLRLRVDSLIQNRVPPTV